MANLNKVFLMGNLTRDPEVRYTPKGTAIAKLGLAVSRRWTTDTGEQKDEVTFVDVDVWGRQAETIGQYMSKGKPIFIEGRLKFDSWEDKESGQKKTKLRVVCENFQFIGAPSGRGEIKDEPPGSSQQVKPGGRPMATREQAAPADEAPPAGEEDNIPF